jgi:hypothetical protein
MAKEIKPGIKCRIVGSAMGPKGSSIGKIVKVVGLAEPPVHVVWGDMWEVEAVDGSVFKVKITSPDMQTSNLQDSKNAVCAGDWLEPLEDDPTPPAVKEREVELTD